MYGYGGYGMGYTAMVTVSPVFARLGVTVIVPCSVSVTVLIENPFVSLPRTILCVADKCLSTAYNFA